MTTFQNGFHEKNPTNMLIGKLSGMNSTSMSLNGLEQVVKKKSLSSKIAYHEKKRIFIA